MYIWGNGRSSWQLLRLAAGGAAATTALRRRRGPRGPFAPEQVLARLTRVLCDALPVLAGLISHTKHMNRHTNNRKLMNGAKQGAHILERGLQIYHGVRGALAAGSAVAASAAAPYMTAMGAVL